MWELFKLEPFMFVDGLSAQTALSNIIVNAAAGMSKIF